MSLWLVKGSWEVQDVLGEVDLIFFFFKESSWCSANRLPRFESGFPNSMPPFPQLSILGSKQVYHEKWRACYFKQEFQMEGSLGLIYQLPAPFFLFPLPRLANGFLLGLLNWGSQSDPCSSLHDRAIPSWHSSDSAQWRKSFPEIPRRLPLIAPGWQLLKVVYAFLESIAGNPEPNHDCSLGTSLSSWLGGGQLRKKYWG